MIAKLEVTGLACKVVLCTKLPLARNPKMTDQEGTGVPTESPEQALARLRQAADAEIDRVFDEVTSRTKRAPRAKLQKDEPRLEIKNYGRVASMSMPPGWLETMLKNQSTDKSKLREFHHPTNSLVRIDLYFRGYKISNSAADSFKLLLSKRPHFLTPAELKSFGEVLSDRGTSDKFKMLVAATRDINNNTVLVIEGRQCATQEDAYILYIDIDGTGSLVQEISFQSPHNEYPHCFSHAMSAFKSIQWR